MATFTKILLSASTNGRGVLVTATGSTGTTIHTTGTSSSTFDEVWLYAENTYTANIILTVEFGGTTNPNDRIQVSIPAQSGLSLIVPGLCLTGTGSVGSTITAYADTASKINILGYINRIS